MEQMQIKTEDKTDEKLYLTCPWCGSDSKFSFKIVLENKGMMTESQAVIVECYKCKDEFALIRSNTWRELRRRFDKQTTK